jgi:hypothetical protein
MGEHTMNRNIDTFVTWNVSPSDANKRATVAMAKPNPAPQPTFNDATRYVSRVDTGIDGLSGVRVVAGQNTTFTMNAEPGMQLTDHQLAMLWRWLWPLAVEFTPKHVAGARRDFVRGTHGNPNAKPAPDTIKRYRVSGSDDDATVIRERTRERLTD